MLLGPGGGPAVPPLPDHRASFLILLTPKGMPRTSTGLRPSLLAAPEGGGSGAAPGGDVEWPASAAPTGAGLFTNTAGLQKLSDILQVGTGLWRGHSVFFPGGS